MGTERGVIRLEGAGESLVIAFLILSLGVWLFFPGFKRASMYFTLRKSDVVTTSEELEYYSVGEDVLAGGLAHPQAESATPNGFVIWHRMERSGGSRYNARTWRRTGVSEESFRLSLSESEVQVNSGYRLLGNLQRQELSPTEYVEGVVAGEQVLVYGNLVGQIESESIQPVYVVAGSKVMLLRFLQRGILIASLVSITSIVAAAVTLVARTVWERRLGRPSTESHEG
jgi:hypothetical protein